MLDTSMTTDFRIKLTVFDRDGVVDTIVCDTPDEAALKFNYIIRNNTWERFSPVGLGKKQEAA
jgi:hypothetical protein